MLLRQLYGQIEATGVFLPHRLDTTINPPVFPIPWHLQWFLSVIPGQVSSSCLYHVECAAHLRTLHLFPLLTGSSPRALPPSSSHLSLLGGASSEHMLQTVASIPNLPAPCCISYHNFLSPVILYWRLQRLRVNSYRCQ